LATIRELRPEDDLGDLTALSRAFFEEYEAHHREFFKIDQLRDSDIADYFSRSANADDGVTFVAILDGRMVGYMTAFVRRQAEFYKVRHVGAISGLMVHKDHRRKNIARSLLEATMAFFQKKGVEYFTVYTAAVNQAAVRFYERSGMKLLHVTLIGEVPGGPQRA